MCLIAFAYKSHPTYSFILAANRDEFYERQSAPLAFWNKQKQILAGRDLEQGGTWLGLNDQGLFATVTNYRDGINPESRTLLSRGALTRNFLEQKATAYDYFSEIEEQKQQYGGFNLLLGDALGIYHLSNKGLSSKKLSPGVYGLSNALLNTPWPKLIRTREQLSLLLKQPEIDPNALLTVMQNTQQAEDSQLPNTGVSYDWEKLLSSCFIRAETYGTRATTLLLQKPCGETIIIEQNYDENGLQQRSQYRLELTPVGLLDNP